MLRTLLRFSWVLALTEGFLQMKSNGRSVGSPMQLEMLWGGSKGSSAIPASKKIAVVTGTTSGLGLETARALINRGDYYVICANRDVGKMEAVAEQEGFDAKSYKVMELDLGSFDSTRKFAKNLQSVKSRSLNALVCNAAVYQPALDKVRLMCLGATREGVTMQPRLKDRTPQSKVLFVSNSRSNHPTSHSPSISPTLPPSAKVHSGRH